MAVAAAPRSDANHAEPADVDTPRRHRDALQVPLIGPFLCWRHARTSMQLPLLLISLLILFDGFSGPQVSPENVAGVLP